MKYIKSAVLLLAALFVLSAFHKDKRITIFMVGDSTMANKDISGGKVERGWGMMLCNYFSDDVVVDNHAKNIPFVAIAGENEIAEGKVMLKDMVKGEQRLVSADELIEALA